MDFPKSLSNAFGFFCAHIFIMKNTLESILAEVRVKVADLKTRAEFEAFKATVSGPKGSLTHGQNQPNNNSKQKINSYFQTVFENQTLDSSDLDV